MKVLRVGAKAIFILLTLVFISTAVSRAGHAGVLTAIAERVVSLWQPQNELLLALGLQEQIIAFAGMYTDLPADLAAATEGIPSIGTAMDWPAKEVMLTQQADLVVAELLEGFAFDSAMGKASVAELEAAGAQVYSASACTIADYPNKRIYLVLVDLVGRTIMAPQELPVGIVTAALGGPFFLWLLRRR